MTAITLEKPGTTMPDGSIYAGTSPDTGRPMYATVADAPVTFTFERAAAFASQHWNHGHEDWRIPSKAELHVLFENRAAIGGFDQTGHPERGWYWSSSSLHSTNAWAQRFRDGGQYYDDRSKRSALRCVRG